MLVSRYVPTHLHQMLFELVKNSLRAVQERFRDDDNECPPIRVVVADGIEDVTIKVLQFSFYICLYLVTFFMSTCSLSI
jgi:hypothetical protein